VIFGLKGLLLGVDWTMQQKVPQYSIRVFGSRGMAYSFSFGVSPRPCKSQLAQKRSEGSGVLPNVHYNSPSARKVLCHFVFYRQHGS
jgi:hypothetical protein